MEKTGLTRNVRNGGGGCPISSFSSVLFGQTKIIFFYFCSFVSACHNSILSSRYLKQTDAGKVMPRTPSSVHSTVILPKNEIISESSHFSSSSSEIFSDSSIDDGEVGMSKIMSTNNTERSITKTCCMKKTPLKRCNAANVIVNDPFSKDEIFRLSEKSRYSASNNEQIQQHQFVNSKKGYNTNEASNCRYLKSNYLEIGIEDEDRFLPSDLLEDPTCKHHSPKSNMIKVYF